VDDKLKILVTWMPFNLELSLSLALAETDLISKYNYGWGACLTASIACGSLNRGGVLTCLKGTK